MMEKGKELQFPRRTGGSGIREADSDEGGLESAKRILMTGGPPIKY